MKEEIFDIIQKGLESRNSETRQVTKNFAEAIRRTSMIVKEEKKHHIKNQGKDYLKQLAFMTSYILNHNELPIENRMKTIAEKLEEMEWHQKHHLIILRRARLQEIEKKTAGKKGRKTGKAKTKRKVKEGKKVKGKRKAKPKKQARTKNKKLKALAKARRRAGKKRKKKKK